MPWLGAPQDGVQLGPFALCKSRIACPGGCYCGTTLAIAQSGYVAIVVLPLEPGKFSFGYRSCSCQ